MCDLCTPVVCIGVAPALAPSNSVSPPSADKLDRAFNAPGLANNCARGIALANGDVVALGAGPGPDPPVVGEFWASRLAFCSSTLGKTNTEKYVYGILRDRFFKKISGSLSRFLPKAYRLFSGAWID